MTDGQNTWWLVFRGWMPGQFRTWQEVRPPDAPFHLNPAPWRAPDPGSAFRLAVLDNKDEQSAGTSYLVLPFARGATFNVSLNVEATEHDATSGAFTTRQSAHDR